MTKRFCLLLLALLTFTSPALGAEYYIDDIYSAEQIARGNVEGFSQGSLAIWENPASLVSVSNISTGWFNAKFMFDEVIYNNYSIAYRSPFGLIAAGYYEVKIADIEHNAFNNLGEAETLSTYSFLNQVAKVAYQNSINDQTSLGFAINGYRYQGYALTGKGFSADMGVRYDIPLKMNIIKKISVSTTYKNFIPQKVNFSNDQSASIPSSLVFSGNANIWNDYDIYLQKIVRFDKKHTSAAGMKYTPSWVPFRTISISGGVSEYLIGNRIDKIWSCGVGLMLPALTINFAYQPNQYTDKQYYYSVTINL